MWVAIGIGVFVLTLIVVRDVRVFERYRYTVAAARPRRCCSCRSCRSSAARSTARGSGSRIGPLTFEPSEIAKVLLVAFFAAYLVDKRELLTQGRVRIGRCVRPVAARPRPAARSRGASSLLVLAYEKDIGTSLLFFGVFAAMLYMATGAARTSSARSSCSSIGACRRVQRVRARARARRHWLNPWTTAQTTGFQIIQAWYAFGSGGIAGTGLGLGSPDLHPERVDRLHVRGDRRGARARRHDRRRRAFMLLVGSAFRIAVDAVRPFSKLFAAGIATILGFQTFLIIGGVTRVIPLTGITLPFVSYGGSSLVANFVLLAILLRISDDNARDATAHAAGAP